MHVALSLWMKAKLLSCPTDFHHIAWQPAVQTQIIYQNSSQNQQYIVAQLHRRSSIATIRNNAYMPVSSTCRRTCTQCTCVAV